LGLQAPVLSVFDPLEAAEGSVDPLSLQATYEHLAERVYPFMTVRMSRIRFLTAIAVISQVCEGLEDAVASDGITPAWLVCEWYAVEAFMRRREMLSEQGRLRIPGSQKVERALRDGRRLGAAAYLKTPKVFGFTGIYKTLAVGLQLISDDVLPDSGCFELLKVWEREQGLRGLLDGQSGPGASLRQELHRAVEAGLRKGYTDRPAGWSVFDSIAQHLDPGRIGKKEADWLHARLLDAWTSAKTRDPEATRMRREVFSLIESGGSPVINRNEESTFFRDLLRAKSGATAELKERIEAIDAYEGLASPIEKALRLILHLSSEQRCGPVTAEDFATDKRAKKLAALIEPAVRRIEGTFAGSSWQEEVLPLATRYSGIADAPALFSAVVGHHESAQRAKPPDGKRPWFERIHEHAVAVRPLYVQQDAPNATNEYLRDYRSSTASRFLQDLRRLPA
jgi:hypothetical protein